MYTASVCTIGDEILIGQITDTNSGEIARELNKIGIKVVFMASLRDEEAEIESGLNLCMERSDIVIVTGGLGPTSDDRTKKVVSKMFGQSLTQYHSGQLEIIKDICRKRGVELSDLNRDQALVPQGCTVLVNRQGTAPGMILQKRGSEKVSGRHPLLCLLPGVPYEMRSLLKPLSEYITGIYQPEEILHKNILTYGIAESKLSEMLTEWERSLPSAIHLAYLPSPHSGVKLRLSVYGEEHEYAARIISESVKGLKEILKESIYGEDEDTLEGVVANMLSSRSETLSLSESCTGGRISARITSLSGSSSFFEGAVVAYANSVKTTLLGVENSWIVKYGAVSKECAIAMAEGVREIMKTDCSIATTGIAGPAGGTANKPVGTVWIAVSGQKGTKAFKFVFTGEREQNIERASSHALNLLRLYIDNKLK